ncbi:MAG: hypothetical protein WBF24_01250 [Xanthobacteraceae bacterium]
MESASLSSLDNLTHLGLRSGVDMQPTLLRVLTDLYVQKLTHTPDEERHYTELALRLLDAVDVTTRAAVAGRLARHLSPPLRVIQQLAADLPDVAAPLRGHPVLHRKTPISEPAMSVAAAAEDGEPARSESTERQQEFPHPAPALNLIAADVASELNELFFAAGTEERRLILLNLEIAAPLPVDRVRLAFDAAVGPRLEAAALARDREDFSQHLANSLQIPRAQARRIASDVLGEPIIVAAKAMAMPRNVVYRILLFVNTTVGHSVERVHALAALYDELPIQAAEHMVAIWQALHPRQTAKHRPFVWNDEARARARTATVAVRRAPASQRTNERRDIS